MPIRIELYLGPERRNLPPAIAKKGHPHPRRGKRIEEYYKPDMVARVREGCRKGGRMVGGRYPGWKHTRRPVRQIDRSSFKTIKVWPSGAEASRATGINVKAINDCCHGRSRSSGGYIWEFDD